MTIQRYKYGYVADEWGMNRSLGLIADPAGNVCLFSDVQAAIAQPRESAERYAAEHWHSLYLKKCQELHDEKARLGAEKETLELAAIDDAEREAQPSQAREVLDYGQKSDIVSNWFSDESMQSRAMQMLGDIERAIAAINAKGAV